MSYFGVLIRGDVAAGYSTRTIEGRMYNLNYPYNAVEGRRIVGMAPGIVFLRTEAERDQMAQEIAAAFPGVSVECINVTKVYTGQPGQVTAATVGPRGVLPL